MHRLRGRHCALGLLFVLDLSAHILQRAVGEREGSPCGEPKPDTDWWHPAQG